jgi:uncharacterized membrane protein
VLSDKWTLAPAGWISLVIFSYALVMMAVCSGLAIVAVHEEKPLAAHDVKVNRKTGVFLLWTLPVGPAHQARGREP